MKHPTDDELEAMAFELTNTNNWETEAHIRLADQAAAMLRACKTGGTSDHAELFKNADGLIGEPHLVQTSYCNGKAISLDLPPYAQKAFDEIMDRQWNAAIEAAANACISAIGGVTHYGSEPYEICAAAIRALKKGQTND